MGVVGVLSDIEEYRRDVQAFLTEHERLDYLHHAGHAADLPLDPLFERFEHLFSEDAAKELVAAIDTARPGDEAASRRALAGFAVGGLMQQTVRRQTEELARSDKGVGKQKRGGRGKANEPIVDADVAALERQLADTLGLRVQIAHGESGGTVTISYSTLDQLDMLCQRMSGEPI